MNDKECAAFINSKKFKKQFHDILKHDKELFDEPTGWQTKSVAESPLITDFESIWKQVKGIYRTELSALAFNEIPNEKVVGKFVHQLNEMIE